MKKLISLLLVLTLALSLVGGLGVSAMASDEAPEAAQGETTDTTPPAENEQAGAPTGGETGAPAGDVTDGETGETDGSDETGEITEPTEGGDITVDPSAVDAPPAKPWKTANNFVAGQEYVIIVDGKAIANNNGTITVSDTTDGSDASTVWTAASGAQLTNGGVNFYYDKANLVISTTAESKANWKYDGTLYYQAGGDTYSISGISGSSVAVVKNGTGCAVTLKTNGTDAGSSSSGGGNEPSAPPSGSGTSVSYEGTNTLAPGANVSFIVDGFTFGVDRGSLYVGAATVTDGKLTVATSNFLTFGADGSLFTEDPPGEYAYLYIEGGALKVTTKGGSNPGGSWSLVDGKLSYTAGGTTWYITGASASAITAGTDAAAAITVSAYTGTEAPSKGGPGGPGGPGGEAVDAEAPVIVTYPKAVPYVKEGTDYAAPSYSISAKLAEGVGSRSIYFQWFVGDVAVTEKTKVSLEGLQGGIATNNVTIDALKGMPTGVYQVTCQVTCNTNGGTTPHTTKATVTFAVCKGVLENSFLTFSDVHETFKNVGMAVYDTIIANDGYIPALIICTGDWANGHLTGGDANSENYKTTMNDYIALLKAQSAGIDMIFVSGNHDNGQAATDATIEAGLGAAADYDGVGIAYDSRNAPKANSSKANSDLVVFAINYEALEVEGGGYSYASVLPKLTAALEKLDQDDFTGKFVVSAHAGLHVLGAQEESSATEWSGGDQYNVDKSDEMVALLNSYADKMDIMFLFGHDHSKGESELFLNPGDTIVSTTSYGDKSKQEQEIKFSYGHAGYITNTIGGQEKFTVVTWDENGFNPELNTVEQLTAPAVKSTISSGSGSNGGTSTRAPKTGDDSNIVLWASLFFLCAGAAVVVATRRKEYN